MVEPERRWLDGGVWSCRIKLPQPQTNRQQPASIANDDESCSTGRAPAMDLPLETTSPRRNNIADALQNMPSMNHHIDALDAPLDPDAQATVSDFLDFTDYLPSDTIRSLTLVGNLDGTHREACISLNELTKTYGQLPSLPADGKPEPLKLRADISSTVTESVRARSLATAEASRMAENADRHLARARNIYAKLQEIRDHYPTSREPSPELQKGSKSPQLNRTPKPKITLRLDGSARPAADQNVPKVRHHRAPRITVPGEVLAPYELDYESYGSETGESSDDDRISSRATPGRSLAGGTIKLKIKDKAPKQKIPKPPRPPRPLGMGTNVHSAVAGISTSNALAKLKPPPENAVLGSSDAPWLQLTAYELAKLRKRMKKNAVWSPSDTMISRELKNLGRGIEAYRAAKIKADAAGEPITHSIQPLVDGDDGTRVYQEGAISTEALEKEEVQLSNRGMKLNEAKKLKRENQAKELAKQAAEEAEESAHKMAKAAQAVKDLFSNAEPAEEKKTPAKTPKKAAPKKRKREADVESHIEKMEADTPKPVVPYAKRNKTETPIPVPQPIIAALESAPSTSSETAPPSVTDSTHIPPTPSSPKKSSTPILPPGTVKKDVKKEVKKPQPIRTSNRQSSAAPTPTPVPEPLPAKRPTSARAAVSRPTSRGKAASVEPASTVAKDRPRRASTAHNTPAPEIRAPANRRTKRPAPGIVTGGAGIEGPKAISKRAAAPKKKNSKKRKDDKSGIIEEDQVEVDDEGNVIDPDEPRYCVCNRVSFGTMIGCESADCEKEWFHLECVGLTDIPSRTTKWYCPDCRVRLGLGEKGEITARGKKK